jgi:hypothetical protein
LAAKRLLGQLFRARRPKNVGLTSQARQHSPDLLPSGNSQRTSDRDRPVSQVPVIYSLTFQYKSCAIGKRRISQQFTIGFCEGMLKPFQDAFQSKSRHEVSLHMPP